MNYFFAITIAIILLIILSAGAKSLNKKAKLYRSAAKSNQIYKDIESIKSKDISFTSDDIAKAATEKHRPNPDRRYLPGEPLYEHIALSLLDQGGLPTNHHLSILKDCRSSKGSFFQEQVNSLRIIIAADEMAKNDAASKQTRLRNAEVVVDELERLLKMQEEQGVSIIKYDIISIIYEAKKQRDELYNQLK